MKKDYRPYRLKHKVTGLYFWKGPGGITLKEDKGKVYTSANNHITSYGDKYVNSVEYNGEQMYLDYEWFVFHSSDKLLEKYPILKKIAKQCIPNYPEGYAFPLRKEDFEKEYLNPDGTPIGNTFSRSGIRWVIQSEKGYEKPDMTWTDDILDAKRYPDHDSAKAHVQLYEQADKTFEGRERLTYDVLKVEFTITAKFNK